MTDIPELLPIDDLKLLQARGISWQSAPKLWLFIQIDKDLRGCYWSLHGSELKMRRDALRMENQEFTIRQFRPWNSPPTAAQEGAYDMLGLRVGRAGLI
jgi:hypothetical protein